MYCIHLECLLLCENILSNAKQVNTHARTFMDFFKIFIYRHFLIFYKAAAGGGESAPIENVDNKTLIKGFLRSAKISRPVCARICDPIVVRHKHGRFHSGGGARVLAPLLNAYLSPSGPHT